MLKQIGFGLGIVLLWGSTCFAGALEDGFAAFGRGEFDQAFRHWMPLAQAGDPVAQFNIGILFEQGRGAAQDPAEAMRWYLRAAKTGDVVSQFKLGLIYAEGEGFSQNYSEAAKWYLLAAESNHVRAQFRVGTMYANGQGLPQDLGLATAWYERAEETSCTYGDIEAANGPRLN